MTTGGNSRWRTYAQCKRAPKPDTFRPVTERWGKDAAEVDMNVCGVHAGVYDRALAKQKAEDAKRRSGDAREANAKAACERLADEFGLAAEVHTTYNYRDGFRTTGRVVVDPVALLRLLNPINHDTIYI